MQSKFASFIIFSCLLLLTACSTYPPMPIPEDNPPLSVVRDSVTAYQGKQVAWGGVILDTQILENTTRIAILAKPLDSTGEPQEVDQGLGRFIATFSGFRDPAIFAQGRLLTVVGPVVGSEVRKVGDFDYEYVIIQAETGRLWPIRQPRYYYDDHYWYDPWYPWYPWYPPYYPYYPYYPPSPPAIKKPR